MVLPRSSLETTSYQYIEKRDNRQQTIYMFAILAIIIKAFLNFSELVSMLDILENHYTLIDKSLSALFLGLMMYKLYLQTYSRMKFWAIFFLGLCCLYTYYNAKYYYLISSFLCIVNFEGIDIRRVVRWIFRSNVVYLAIHIFVFWCIFFFRKELLTYSYRNDSTVKRFTFLLSHVNTFSMYLSWTILAYIYINFKRMTKIKLLICLLVNLSFFVFTRTGTSLIVVTGTILLVYIVKFTRIDIEIILHRISQFGFWGLGIFFPWLIIQFINQRRIGSEIFTIMNKVFTGRLQYGAFAFHKFGASLFGQIIYQNNYEYWRGIWYDEITTDNTYMLLFVCYGFLYTILIGAGFAFIASKARTEERIMIIAYMIYGIMEDYIINVVFCFPLLFIGYYIFGDIKRKEKDEKEKEKLVGYS